MNSRVVFEDETTGERREVTLVYPRDADISCQLARRCLDYASDNQSTGSYPADRGAVIASSMCHISPKLRGVGLVAVPIN